MSAKNARIIKMTKIFVCKIVWVNLFFVFLFTLPFNTFSLSILVIIYGEIKRIPAAAFLFKLLSDKLKCINIKCYELFIVAYATVFLITKKM